MEDKTNRLVTHRFGFAGDREEFSRELPRIKRGQVVSLTIEDGCLVVVCDPNPAIGRRGVSYQIPELGGHRFYYFVRSFGTNILVGSPGLGNNPHLPEATKAICRILDQNQKDDVVFVGQECETETLFNKYAAGWQSLRREHGFYLISYNEKNFRLIGVHENDRRHLKHISLLANTSSGLGVGLWRTLPHEFSSDIVSLPFRFRADNVAAVPITTKNNVLFVDLCGIGSNSIRIVRELSRGNLRFVGESVAGGIILRDTVKNTVMIIPKTTFYNVAERMRQLETEVA